MKTALIALFCAFTSTATHAVDFFQCWSEHNEDYANIVRINIDTEALTTDADGNTFKARRVLGAVGRTSFIPADGIGTATDDKIDLLLVRDDIIVGKIDATIGADPNYLHGTIQH